jgi:hypothetical protein
MSCAKPVVGSVVTLQFRFFVLDVQDGKTVRIPATPTTVDVAVEKPDGTVLPISAVAVLVGVYEALVDTDQSGRWSFTVSSTGVPTVVDNGSFTVVPQRVTV